MPECSERGTSMSEARQKLPTLLMWERVLRIRQRLYGEESRSSVHAPEGVLAGDATDLESLREELMRKTMTGESLDMPFETWDTFDNFGQWDRRG